MLSVRDESFQGCIDKQLWLGLPTLGLKFLEIWEWDFRSRETSAGNTTIESILQSSCFLGGNQGSGQCVTGISNKI